MPKIKTPTGTYRFPKEAREQAREQLIAAARAAGCSVDTEGGPLCPTCAMVSLDSEYEWVGLAHGCYNCNADYLNPFRY